MRLFPDDKSHVDFILFIVAWKMSRTGKHPKEIFEAMDNDGGGSLDRQELVTGLRSTMGIMLNDEEVDILLNYIDEDKTGTIELDEFNDKVSFLNSKHRKKDAWMVSKCQYMLALAGEYEAKRQRDYDRLKVIFVESDDNGDGVLELHEF